MKIRRFKSFSLFGFIGIFLISFVGDSSTFESRGRLLPAFNSLQFISVSGCVSAVLKVPFILLFQSQLSVECTTATSTKAIITTTGAESKSPIPFSTAKHIQDDDRTKTSSSSALRQPKILKELTMLNRQSCLSKILCGVDIAKPPTSSSSTINDYAYLVKSFFDQLSLSGGANNGLELDDEKSDEEEDDQQENSFRSKNRRKNSKRPYTPYEEGEIDQLYSHSLEELVGESDGLFDFRRRHGKEHKNSPVQEVIKVQINCNSSNSTECPSQPKNPKRNDFSTRTRTGFMGFTNPRFDKTAFLDKKQLQLQTATSEQDKLNIASEVAARLRSPRQCRLLNWFQPKYTTTTTITTTSNDPSIASLTNGGIVNSMCPFSVQELQKMISDSQGLTTTAGSGTPAPLGQQASSSSLANMHQLLGINALNPATTNSPTKIAKLKPYTISPIKKQQIYPIPELDEKPTPTPHPQSFIVPTPARPPVKTTKQPSNTIDDENEIQPHPNVAGTSPFNRPKYRPRPPLRPRPPQNNEKSDIHENPHVDFFPQRYHYRPQAYPTTPEPSLMKSPSWTEVIKEQLPIYPYPKSKPIYQGPPGKILMDHKLKSDESSDNNNDDDDSQEKSEEDNPVNWGARNNPTQSEERFEEVEHKDDLEDESEERSEEVEHKEKDESDEDGESHKSIGPLKSPNSSDMPPNAPHFQQQLPPQRDLPRPPNNHYQSVGPINSPNNRKQRPTLSSVLGFVMGRNKSPNSNTGPRHTFGFSKAPNNIPPPPPPQAGPQSPGSSNNIHLQDPVDQESEESEEDHTEKKRHANNFDEKKPVSVKESEELDVVSRQRYPPPMAYRIKPENHQTNDDDELDEDIEIINKNTKDHDENESEENKDIKSNNKGHKNPNNDESEEERIQTTTKDPNVAKIVHERDPNDESEEETQKNKYHDDEQNNEENSEEDTRKSDNHKPSKNKPAIKDPNNESEEDNNTPQENINLKNKPSADEDPNESEEDAKDDTENESEETNKDHETPESHEKSQPPKRQPQSQEKQKESEEDEFSGKNKNTDDDDEDDESQEEIDDEKAEIEHKPLLLPLRPQQRPNSNLIKPHPISKKNAQKTTPKPVAKDKKTNNSTSTSSTGFFKSFLSKHGVRTLSSITSLFYSSPAEDEPPPPPPSNKEAHRPPKRHRRRRKRPPPRPQYDQSDNDDEDEEDDEEEDDEDDKKETKEKKKKPTPKPSPRPLPPVHLPPKIIAVPIYLEGRESWEQKPDEEEFFENTKKVSSSKKPEKYDYDDDTGSEESNKSSPESLNTSEGVDFGPGQKIQTEYSEIVDGFLRPGDRLVNNERYVSGLPTSWENIYKEALKKKKNKQTESSSLSNETNDDNENSEESEEDDRSGPPPKRRRQPSQNIRHRPTPQQYVIPEPID